MSSIISLSSARCRTASSRRCAAELLRATKENSRTSALVSRRRGYEGPIGAELAAAGPAEGPLRQAAAAGAALRECRSPGARASDGVTQMSHGPDLRLRVGTSQYRVGGSLRRRGYRRLRHGRRCGGLRGRK
eukprot:1175760-Prorocentrum_minimum.AAC.2